MLAQSIHYYLIHLHQYHFHHLITHQQNNLLFHFLYFQGLYLQIIDSNLKLDYRKHNEYQYSQYLSLLLNLTSLGIKK